VYANVAENFTYLVVKTGHSYSVIEINFINGGCVYSAIENWVRDYTGTGKITILELRGAT
jgi:hypothetical protein